MKTIFAYGESHRLKLLKDQLSPLYNFHEFTCSNNENPSFDQYSSIKPDIILIYKIGNSDCNLEFIKHLRTSAYCNIPLIAISGSSCDNELERTINAGADDFISSPFTKKQLTSRIYASLRRGLTFSINNLIKYKDLSVNKNNKDVEVNGKPINLTPIEYKILTSLMEKPDTLIDRGLLIDSCFLKGGSKSFSLNVHIFALRKKLGTAGSYIHTIRGNGYKLN